jgi:Zn-finger nucleic acid-binding protein
VTTGTAGPRLGRTSSRRAGGSQWVTEVPVEECPACGEVWFAEGVAIHLDELLREMLATELVAVRPYSEPASSAA